MVPSIVHPPPQWCHLQFTLLSGAIYSSPSRVVSFIVYHLQFALHPSGAIYSSPSSSCAIYNPQSSRVVSFIVYHLQFTLLPSGAIHCSSSTLVVPSIVCPPPVVPSSSPSTPVVPCIVHLHAVVASTFHPPSQWCHLESPSSPVVAQPFCISSNISFAYFTFHISFQ